MPARLGLGFTHTPTIYTHAPRHRYCRSISISESGCSATCIQSEPRGLVFGTVGFSRGVHYWEIKIEQSAEMGGSIFLGVAEKGPDGKAPRLTRWQGWGVINYRASFHNNTERVYGDHFKANDTVGLRLDMDKVNEWTRRMDGRGWMDADGWTRDSPRLSRTPT